MLMSPSGTDGQRKHPGFAIFNYECLCSHPINRNEQIWSREILRCINFRSHHSHHQLHHSQHPLHPSQHPLHHSHHPFIILKIILLLLVIIVCQFQWIIRGDRRLLHNAALIYKSRLPPSSRLPFHDHGILMMLMSMSPLPQWVVPHICWIWNFTSVFKI